jgi:dipeptidase
MCDAIVAVPPATTDGAVWFGKNSDREPGEAQPIEHLAAAKHPPGARVRTTYLEIPQAAETHEAVISRPAWMWGCEMGANAHGLAIGNVAVFTRVPVALTGLTGMDLQRLALERAKGAREALDLVTRLLATHGQGGAAEYRHKRLRYHNAFLLADPEEAWLLETAGPFWAAVRVRGIRTTSNVLTIGEEHELLGDGTIEHARSKGWLARGETFDFARCFGDPLFRHLTGGDVRRACTLRSLTTHGRVDRAAVIAALRDHGGSEPDHGPARILAPCAHASYWPTRAAGQTTSSMVSRLDRRGSTHWLTGTSSPCLSVFKPVVLGAGAIDTGPSPGPRYDRESLFWRHERLHRIVLRDYAARSAVIDVDRRALEARALAELAPDAATCNELWATHRNAVVGWADRAKQGPATRRRGLFDLYWKSEAWRDDVPR